MAPLTAVEPSPSSAHVSISYFTCAKCRGPVFANEEPQAATAPATPSKLAADLYHELRAAQAIISAMQNVLTPSQKWSVAEEVAQAGLTGKGGATYRTAERHAALSSAAAAGVK